MKRIILGICLFFVVAFIAATTLKVNAQITETITLTDGVSIRTESPNGLKWEATVSNPVDGAKYGIVFAQGVVNDLTVNTPNAAVGETDELAENNQFRVTMINFPIRAFKNDISARAYIKLGDEYVYSENIVIRNLYNLAEKYKAKQETAGNNVAQLITDVLDSHYDITYVISENELPYSTRQEMIDDFFKDFNEFKGGTSYNANNLTVLTNHWGLNDIYGFLSNTTYKTKWLWLIDYLSSTTTGSSNKVALDKLLGTNNVAWDSSEDPYGLEYEVAAFLNGSQHTLHTQTRFHSADYSDEKLANGFWTNLEEQYGGVNSKVLGSYTGQKLPTLENIGYNLLGWYDNPEFSGSAITTSSNSLTTLYGKWEKILYNINYSYEKGGITTKTKDDFISAFWNDYYNWYMNKYPSEKVDIETFKTNVLADWKDYSDSTYTYKLYLKNNQGVLDPDSEYYLHTDIELLNWFEEFGEQVLAAAAELQNTDTSPWSNYVAGYYRLYTYLSGQATTTTWKEARALAVAKAYLLDPTFDYDYYYGDVVELPVLESNDGDIFRGWFDENNNKIERISSDMYGNFNLTAKWMPSNAVDVILSNADASVIESIEPTYYVNSSFVSGKVYIINDVQYTYGVNAFATINEALEVAKANSDIYVFAGTYSEAVSIATEGISIYGPNYNISGTSERNNEAVITALFNVNASNVTLNGIAFEGTSSIILGAVSNTKLLNLYCTASSSFTTPLALEAIVYSNNKLNNLIISDSYFYSTNTIYRPIVLVETVTNLTIENNYIGNATGTGLDELAVSVYKVAGEFKLQDNEIDFTTNNFSLYIGYDENSCTEMWIKDNIITGDYIGAIGIYKFTDPNGAVHIVGNTIENSNQGNNFRFENGTGNVFIKYNYFNNWKYKLQYPGECKLVFEHNVYNPAPEGDALTSYFDKYVEEYTKNPSYTNEQRLSDYLLDETYNEDIYIYSITYMYGEEKLTCLTPNYFTEFSSEIILPTYEVDEYHTFQGWYDNPEFVGDPITSIPTGTTDDKIFYAKVTTSLVEVNVTLNAEGGSLPLSYDESAKLISVYSNDGLASGTYLCDTSVQPYNSLRWQNKVLLNYDPTLKAYKVVYLDAATISAFASNVTWTHALSNASSDITGSFTVGDYVIINGTPSVGDSNIAYVVVSDPANYQYPTTANLVLIKETILPVPVREGYTFEGWKSSLDGSIVKTHPNYLENPGDITYTAQWINDNLEEVELTVNDDLVINSIKPNIFVSTSFKADMTYLINGNEYAYGETAFSSIAAALSSAESGSNIYVFGGTYSEALTISTANIGIYGPYYNVHGKEISTRTNEAIISSLVTVKASNVTLAGLKFTGTGSFTDTVSSSHIANVSIYSNTAISDLTVIDSRFSTSIDNYRPIYTTTNTTRNVTINNNYFANGSTGWGIVLYNIGGTFNLENNEFYYSTGGYQMRLGTSANTCTEMWVKDNFISGNKTAAIEIRNFNSTTGGAVHIVGNTIEKSNTGNNFNFSGCTGNVYVKYNYFNNCTYKLTNKGSNTTFANNYYNPAPTVAPYSTEYNNNPSYTNEQRLADYASDPNYNGGLTTYTISYYNGDTLLTNLYPLKYVENSNVIILPEYKLAGYNFLGWYDNEELSGDPITEIPAGSTGDIVLYAKLEEIVYSDITVTFDYEGGVTEELYKTKGTLNSTLKVDSYNGNFWDGTTYANYIFISNSANDPKAKFSTRVYLGLDSSTGLYKVVSILNSGIVSSWPVDASVVITISGQYAGTGHNNFNVNSIKLGDVVLFDKAFTTASSSNIVNLSFYSKKIENEEVEVTLSANYELPTPALSGAVFAGWYDAEGNKYSSVADFGENKNVTVYANWAIEDKIIGSFEGDSWTVINSGVKLNATLVSGADRTIAWKSETPNIASVDEEGNVIGLSEGLAKIVAYDAMYPSISFTFYVTVVSEDSGMLGVILDSNNESIFTRDNLLIGIVGASPAPYYTSVTGSVSKLLFEDYIVHKDYYLSNPTNKSTLTGAGTGGVDFITFHYAADMPYSANYSLKGGSNLASANKSQNANGVSASWHYSTGNDGIWYCQNTAYGAWHAGSTKAMSWLPTGVTTSEVGTDIYTTDVTLRSDNYFYIKGEKTTVKNTTGYSYTKFNKMGLGVKLVGNEWYITNHYYKSSYGYICSVGGNQNTIGIESSVREGSDLWLTWQYSAQLCAKLLIQFNLPLNRLVGHHFFTGKDCPQPLLANDLEIWYEFRDMVEQQLAYYKTYSGYTLSFATNSAYLKSNGRVKNLPEYSECVTYTVTYKTGSTSKTVTLSTILPGTVA